MANRDYTITAPDGTDLTITGPDNATPQQLRAAAEAAFKVRGGSPAAPVDDIPKMLPRQRATALAGMPQSAMQPGDLVAGLVRGAGSIGATLLTPYDMLAGNTKSIGNPERRAAMDQALVQLGADPESFAYKAGKVGGEIAGTAGVGPVLAPVARAAGASPAVVNAISTAGMRTGSAPVGLAARAGDMGIRAAAGAINGAASTAMVSPEDVATGAAIGGATPPVLRAVGATAKLAGRAARASVGEVGNALKSEPTRAAQDIIRALDLTPEQLPAVINKLRGAETLVDGSAPTVAQALSMPQASILERVVAAGPGGEKLRNALVQQSEVRMNALQGVAPVDPNGYAQARADTGEAIGRYAKAERGQAATANAAQYQAVDTAGAARITMPADEMQAAAAQFVGPGAVGKNQMPAQFSREASALSVPEVGRGGVAYNEFGVPLQVAPRASEWQEVMRMRSSLNEQIQAALNNGDNQAAAAMTAQIKALDKAIETQAPTDVLSRWQEANASRHAIGQRFDTGPQAAIFSTRNGEPLAQGGEVAAKFWGNRPGLAEDVQSFRRLIDDNPAMLGQFRSMITTEGADKAAQGSVLGAKFVDWVRNMKPGLREAFEPAQLASLERIAADVERAGAAAKLGMGPGSNTYQNAATALENGFFDSPAARAIAQRTPVINRFAEPLRATLAASETKSKAARLANMLSDAGGTAAELEKRIPNKLTQQFRSIMDMGDQGINAFIPGLGMSMADLIRLGIYKAPAITSAQ